jgi:UDP-glucose 4-epimerase
MKVLITGGAGFIGSHLSDLLIERGDEVYALDDLSTGNLDNIAHLREHENFHFVCDSAGNEGVMTELVQKADHIYHLAAVVGVQRVVESPVRTLEVNLHTTEIALKLAHRFGKQIQIASTSEVYGRHKENRPLRETDERIYGPTTVGRWSYAGAKAIDEFFALAYHRERALSVVITRFFNTVGPRQTGQYGMVVPRFVQSALKGEPITVYGDGSQSRSFTYVGDAVRAITDLMACPAAIGEVFNVGNGEEVTMLNLAQRVKAMTDSTSEIQLVPFEQIYGKDFEDMEFRTPDITKIHQAIGYRPTVDLNGILERVIHHFRAQADGAGSAQKTEGRS